MGHHLSRARWTMLAFKSPIQMLEGEDGGVLGRIQGHTGTQNFKWEMDDWFADGTRVKIFLYKMLEY